MHTEVEKSFIMDKMNIVMTANRPQLAKVSALDVSRKIHQLLSEKDEIRIIFAAGPSQTEFLNELSAEKAIDWTRIIAFHMDEYIGLPADAPQLFGTFLSDLLFSKVKFKQVHLLHPIQMGQDPGGECKRYEDLLKEKPIDMVCLGIGENGHIAFNDPPVADFNDPVWVKVVEMDQKCRQQQVNDGCFARIEDVPRSAISLTIPALLSARYLNVVVPGIRKAEAIKNSLLNEISTACPATILRTHPEVHLYIDYDSVSLARPQLEKYFANS